MTSICDSSSVDILYKGKKVFLRSEHGIEAFQDGNLPAPLTPDIIRPADRLPAMSL